MSIVLRVKNLAPIYNLQYTQLILILEHAFPSPHVAATLTPSPRPPSTPPGCAHGGPFFFQITGNNTTVVI